MRFTPEVAQAFNGPVATARLWLLPQTAAHAARFFEPMQDDALYQWISSPKPVSLDALQARWARNERRLSPEGTQAWLAWSVQLRNTGAFIGRVDANIEPDGHASNFGYLFFSTHWGQGFASEAVSAVAHHLLGLGIAPLVATVTQGNVASARVLVKCGFAFTRRLPANDVLRGVPVDDEEYVHR